MLACCQLEVLWPFFSDIRQAFSPREHLHSDSHFKLELVVATALVESASGVSKAAQLEIISFASFNAISKPQRLDNSSCYVRWTNAKGSALRLAVPSWPWKKEYVSVQKWNMRWDDFIRSTELVLSAASSRHLVTFKWQSSPCSNWGYKSI